MSTTSRDLLIAPLSANIGVEISGFAIDDLASDGVAERLRAALARYQVIFLRDLHPTPDQHVELARAFGTVTQPSSVMPAVDGHPEILRIDSNRGGGPGTSRWHADITFATRPPGAAVFHAVEMPAVGGVTCFASTQAAFDSLHPDLQRLVLGLDAVHEPRSSLVAAAQPYGGVVWEGEVVDRAAVTSHPVVVRNRRNGRLGLFVNPEFTTRIVGMPSDQSASLLRLLFDHIARDEHSVRYRWTPGTVAAWDNIAVWHRRVADTSATDLRVIERVQIAGTDLGAGRMVGGPDG